MPPKHKSPPPPPPHGPVVVVPPPPYRRRLEIIDLPQGAAAPTTPAPGKWQLPRVPIAFIALYFIVLVYASDLDLSLSLSKKGTSFVHHLMRVLYLLLMCSEGKSNRRIRRVVSC